MSLNLLVTCTLDRVCWSDACPYGIGGYTLSGRTWRIQIPNASVVYGNKKGNNLLEFLGMVTNIWLLTCYKPGTDKACILAIGKNTSTIGWLYSTASCLDPTWAAHEAHWMFARITMARLLMSQNGYLASQHLKGELNLVADWLCFVGSERNGKTHPLAFDDPPPLPRRYTNEQVSRPTLLTDSGQLCHITAAQRDTVLGYASVVNHRIIFDGKQEGSNESNDRTWQQWAG